jgi:hypothetical protein
MWSIQSEPYKSKSTTNCRCDGDGCRLASRTKKFVKVYKGFIRAQEELKRYSWNPQSPPCVGFVSLGKYGGVSLTYC